MGRPSLGARLYLDPNRRVWVLRCGPKFMRTGFQEHQEEAARAVLTRFINKKNPLRQRTIYFVTCDVTEFPIKIGMSSDLAERMRDIRTSLPYEPVLLASFAGTSRNESAIHKQFEQLRIRGEWFRRDPALLAYIEGIGANSVPFTESKN